MVENAQGQILIEYYQCIPKQVTVGKMTYCFEVHWNVCAAWINPQDVAAILAIKGGCCGQKKPGVFRYISENNAHLWQFGERR